MKKLSALLAAALLGIAAFAQDGDAFLKHMYLPVDAGASLSCRDAIGPAFYMRASLEYRFNMHKGPFIVAELDTRTHPYTTGGVQLGNVRAGDIAFTDILIGPGWRFAASENFKIALAIQGGVSNVALKEVAPASTPGQYILNGLEKWPVAGKASMMLEYYLNPAFDLFFNLGLPVTAVPVETSSMDPFVLFPTVSIGFSMALQ